MAHAQLVPDQSVSRRAIRYQSVAGTAAVLIASLVVPAPFAQTDWPNPRRPAFDYSFAAAPGLPEPVLGSVGTSLTAPTFTTPRVPSQVTGTPYTLIAAQAPAALLNLSQEQRWVRTVGFTSVYGSTRLLGSAVERPFVQTNWPNPLGKRQERGWTDSFKLPLTTHKPPFTQYDWPNPRSAKSNPQWERSFPLSLVPPKPFAQTEWPNPRGGPTRADHLYKFEDHVTVFDVPALQRWDSPNPLRATRSVTDWIYGTPPALTAAVVVYPASITFDWPNPRGPQPLNRGFADSFKLPLTTHKGTAQYDWPNPRGASYPTGLRTWIGPKTQEAVREVGNAQEITGPTFTLWSPPVFVQAPPNALTAPVIVPPSEPGLGGAEEIAGPTFTLWSPPAQVSSSPFVLLENATPHIPVGGLEFVKTTVSISVTGPNIVLTAPAAPAAPLPAGEAIYDNPAPKKRHLHDFIGPSFAPNIPAAPLPVGKAHYQLPTLKKTYLYDWRDSFKLPLTTHKPPFTQYNWPNPTLKKWELRDFIGRGLALYLPPPTIPAGKSAYQLPTLKKWHLFDYIWPSFPANIPEPPVPPEPPPPAVPPKHSHGRIRTVSAMTSTRWNRSRGGIRSRGKTRTTPRDDP